MSSRFSAARPKRASEAFARTHHGERGEDEADGGGAGSSSKKVKFDVRNPSALAPDAREEDDVLDADVIGVGSGATTKRGAVNIDGYDSDSDNDTFDARAAARRGKGRGKGDGGEVNLLDELTNYNDKLKNGRASGGGAGNDDDDDDMFAAGNDDAQGDAETAGNPAEPSTTNTGKKDKSVRFLAESEIEGQEGTSKSGGHVRLDDGGSSEDDEEVELAIQEEGVDEEVGLGGLKRHAPKIDAFNMKEEQEDGAFDEAGNYIRKAGDPDAVHDRWLEGVSKREMKAAGQAHERREAELRQRRREDDSIFNADLFKVLILRLEKGETVLEALARLGKGQTKVKKVPKWKQKKQQQKNGGAAGDGDADAMDVDKKKEPEDPEQVRIKEAINAITEAADKLLGRDYPEVYDTEREKLIREYRNETGEDWVEPPKVEEADAGQQAPTMWEYRWTDGRDGAAKQGPYNGPTMKAWQDAGYFGEGVEFRPAGEEGGWTRIATFV